MVCANRVSVSPEFVFKFWAVTTGFLVRFPANRKRHSHPSGSPFISCTSETMWILDTVQIRTDYEKRSEIRELHEKIRIQSANWQN